MRRASVAVVAMILAIAFYFTLFWGFDALRIFTSPAYGLDDPWRAQFIFGLGRFFALSPEGLIKLAAVFGAIKLVVAGTCAVHILDRFRSLIGGRADPEILEAALLLAVIASIVAVLPALWFHNAGQLQEHTINLLLAGLAAALCILERSRYEPAETEAAEAVATPTAGKWFSPWR